MKIFRFVFCKYSSSNPRLDEITKEDLMNENIGFEDFVENVLFWLKKDGVYDDSDYPNTIVIYYAQEP